MSSAEWAAVLFMLYALPFWQACSSGTFDVDV